MTTREYKDYKNLKKESLRDNMTNTELVLNMLAEVATTEISRNENPKGLNESKHVAKRGGNVAGNARKDLESQLGKRVGNMDKNKIEVFGRVLSQKEIEHVFLKAKKLQEENKILKEGLQKFRSVGV